MRTVRSRESVSSAFRRSLAVRSLLLRHPRHIQGLCGYGPASCKVCCCPDSPLLWICSLAERNSQLPGSGSKRRWYKAYLVSFGARQRLAACDSSPGGCRKPGFQCRDQTKGLWRLDISPKVLRSIAGLQCLGDMPWISRATAMRPDTPDLVSDHANVKTDPFAIVAAPIRSTLRADLSADLFTVSLNAPILTAGD